MLGSDVVWSVDHPIEITKHEATVVDNTVTIQSFQLISGDLGKLQPGDGAVFRTYVSVPPGWCNIDVVLIGRPGKRLKLSLAEIL